MEKGWGDEKSLSVHHGGFAHKGIQEKALKECSSGLLKMPRFVKLYQVPLSGASLAAGAKFIPIRMRFLVPWQSALQHPHPTKCFPQLAKSSHLTVTCC